MDNPAMFTILCLQCKDWISFDRKCTSCKHNDTTIASIFKTCK